MSDEVFFDDNMKAWRIRLASGNVVGWYRYKHLAEKAIAEGLSYWKGIGLTYHETGGEGD